jgi:hypothetical protein
LSETGYRRGTTRASSPRQPSKTGFSGAITKNLRFFDQAAGQERFGNNCRLFSVRKPVGLLEQETKTTEHHINVTELKLPDAFVQSFFTLNLLPAFIQAGKKLRVKHAWLSPEHTARTISCLRAKPLHEDF